MVKSGAPVGVTEVEYLLGLDSGQLTGAGDRAATTGPCGERNLGERFQQARTIVCITGTPTGVARGINAGRAVQRVHRQARIISECGAAGETCRVARFDQRVFNEGQSGFFNFRAAQRTLRDDGHAMAGEQGIEFADFAGVAGREDEFSHANFNAASCAAKSS